jgi:pimeloyl-ACP methyl ester carboxylesterase
MWKRPWTVLFAGFAFVTLAAGVYVSTTRTVELGIGAQQAVLEYVLPEHHVFETDRGEVHRYSGGEGRVLVLIHGFGDSASGWAQVVSALAEDYRVVALDHPTRVQRLLLLNAGGASWAQLDEGLLLPKTWDLQRAKNRALIGVKAPSVPDSSSIS